MFPLRSLLKITTEISEIAKEIIPLIDKAPQEDYTNYQNLVQKLLTTAKHIIPSNNIPFNESVQNNYEFLDTLRSILFRFLHYFDNELPSSREHLESLVSRIDKLLTKLNTTPFLQQDKSTTPSDENLQHRKSDTDFTEP
jgi:hypothetical protein